MSPATVILVGTAALFATAVHDRVKAQEAAGQVAPPRPSPGLTTERLPDSLLPATPLRHDVEDPRLDASYEQQCLTLLVAVSSQRPIEFAHASDRLKSSAFSLLDGLAETAADCPATSISITGHTDSSGDERSNLILSKARAQSVVAYLVARGIAADRLRPFGAGSSLPLVEESSVLARARNRRIEFDFSFPARE